MAPTLTIMDGSLRRGREHNNSFFSREEISWAACGNVVTSHLLHNKGRGLEKKGCGLKRGGAGLFRGWGWMHNYKLMVQFIVMIKFLMVQY